MYASATAACQMFARVILAEQLSRNLVWAPIGRVRATPVHPLRPSLFEAGAKREVSLTHRGNAWSDSHFVKNRAL